MGYRNVTLETNGLDLLKEELPRQKNWHLLNILGLFYLEKGNYLILVSLWTLTIKRGSKLPTFY